MKPSSFGLRIPRRLLLLLGLGCAVFADGTVAAPTPSARVFNVRDFGATADGRTLDTTPINRAIQSCAASGGGRVLFPPGRYLSGTVHLRSRVELHLEAGAVLLGTTNLDLYHGLTATNVSPEIPVSRWHRGLILGQGVEAIAISGRGIIDGQHVFDPRGEERMRGPHTILLGSCRNFVLRDLLVTNAGNYALLFFFTDAVTVTNVTFAAGWDGVHFRGSPKRWCHDVLITGCRFFTGDDSIAGSYWDRVLITNCVINSSCNGVRLIGPAVHGVITHCDFPGPGVHPHRTSGAVRRTNMLAGICLQPSAWGAMPGLLDDFRIEDVTMTKVAAPLHLVTRSSNPAGRITVERLRASDVYRAPCSVESWGESWYTNVTFRDVTVAFDGGGSPDDARLPVRAPGVDARKLPAWAFFARGVQRLTLENVRLICEREDARPSVRADGVEHLNLDRVVFSHPASMAQRMILTNAADVSLRQTDVAIVTPRCVAVALTARTTDGRFAVGQPALAAVAVENGPKAGLARIDLRVWDRTISRWVWLDAGQRLEINFPDLLPPKAGEFEAECGGVKARFRVVP